MRLRSPTKNEVLVQTYKPEKIEPDQQASSSRYVRLQKISKMLVWAAYGAWLFIFFSEGVYSSLFGISIESLSVITTLVLTTTIAVNFVLTSSPFMALLTALTSFLAIEAVLNALG